jgi:hypothetical protein
MAALERNTWIQRPHQLIRSLSDTHRSKFDDDSEPVGTVKDSIRIIRQAMSFSAVALLPRHHGGARLHCLSKYWRHLLFQTGVPAAWVSSHIASFLHVIWLVAIGFSPFGARAGRLITDRCPFVSVRIIALPAATACTPFLKVTPRAFDVGVCACKATAVAMNQAMPVKAWYFILP